jgi:hypothetical protein
MGLINSLLARFPIWGQGALTSLCRWSKEGGKNGIALVRAMDTSAVITLRGVQIPALGECARLAIIIIYMMVAIAPAA